MNMVKIVCWSVSRVKWSFTPHSTSLLIPKKQFLCIIIYALNTLSIQHLMKKTTLLALCFKLILLGFEMNLYCYLQISLYYSSRKLYSIVG